MHDESLTDRRNFLAKGLIGATSAFTIGLNDAKALSQIPGSGPPAAIKPPLTLDSLYSTSVLATPLRGEAADRLALRRLVDAWAHCADRRLAETQANLFLPNGTLLNYEGDPATHAPHSTIKGREAIRAALGILKTFSMTLHMNGQSDCVIDGNQAVGETYCLVHQFTENSGQRRCQTLGIRYYDMFLLEASHWYFLERKVIIDWSDSRISVP